MESLWIIGAGKREYLDLSQKREKAQFGLAINILKRKSFENECNNGLRFYPDEG